MIRDLDLDELVGETVELLSRVASARVVKVTSVLASGAIPIKGDHVQLQHVIVNLAVNAMDAMATIPSAQRRISISTMRGETLARISSSDVGPGLPPEKLEEVFASSPNARDRG